MVRWGQVDARPDLAAAARTVMSSELFDLAFAEAPEAAETGSMPADGLGAFAGPNFDKDRIGEYVAQLSLR
jgi:hypothetical protein